MQFFAKSGFVASLIQSVAPEATMPNIYSYWGIIFVFSVTKYPLIYTLTLSTFRKISTDMELAAAVSGCNKIKTFFKITLPMSLSGVANGLLLVFISCLDNFGTVAFLGIPARITVLSTDIYQAIISFSGNSFGEAAAEGVIGVLSSLILWKVAKMFQTMQTDLEDMTPRFFLRRKKLLVEILMPVVNTIDIPKVDKALYKIHSLGYNKAGSNRIRIVRPLTGIDKLWLSLDDTKIMCRPRNPVTEILDGVEYLCLGVETETGVVPRILNTGSVHFFRRGESGTEPEQVGFGVIFPLIAYGRPERYHADICDVVSSEMAHTVTIINEQIIEFFVAKSRSYLLLDNEKFFEQICRMKTCGQVFDVCRIVSQDNAQGLTVYSPLHKTTACTCDTEAGFSAPGYEADSHVLFEKNHRIRLLRDIPRQPCMGCKTGVVVYYNERRDAFISVENETEDYYYPMRDDETLQPGDRVTFFATENLLYKRRRNAGKTMMADNVQYAGAAPSYRGRVVDKVTRQDAASGTTLFELTVAADDKRLPRSQVTITLYDTSNQRWSVISAWEKGTPCSFFIAKGKWYLHLTPDPAQTPSTENAHGE